MPTTAGAQEAGLLKPYMPRVVLRWLCEDQRETFRDIDGTVVFVDISGFTKLSERLAKRGKVGAEELADAINTCFERLLGAAYAGGGSLVKFGGDALLLFFRGEGHATKACRAAVGMRRELREIGALQYPGARVTLRMSVGVHSGTFNFFLVGDSHRELIITGPAASETVLMEGTAEAGEIVISAATADCLDPGIVGAAKGLGFLLKKAPPGLSPSRTAETEPDPALRDLVQCIPTAIREHLLAGIHEPQHRPVTIAFVHFDGTDELIRTAGSERAADEIDKLVRDVQQAADRHGVAFLASDIDKDGGKIILTAGAPVVSENDEERMLLAVREIIERERAIGVRIGVNQGHVFVGDIGPPYRRTYTVMGDAVNLSARVMARAEPGQVLATEPVLEQSHAVFATVPLEPFMVKGKAHPVRASSVGQRTGTREPEQEASLPFSGRETEMEFMLGALDAAREGRGGLIEVIGDAGIGKTRLLEELRARSNDVLVLQAACEPYEMSTPYYPFRGLLRGLFGIADRAPEDVAAARLHEVIGVLAPELLPLAPLVGVAVDLSLPETDATREIEDRFRPARLADAVRTLLVRLLTMPSLLVFEDGHWMDEASADLLTGLSTGIEELPWLVTVTRREGTDGFVAHVDAAALSIRLAPLDAGVAAEIIGAVTEEAPYRPDEVALLAERSGGNPLYLKELLAAASSEGLGLLPDTVETLIMARIDRLEPKERNLLRRASVLGRTFDFELFAAVVDDVPRREDPAWRRLSSVLAIDEGGVVRFANALLRDGAYESLTFKVRRQLHARIGDTIEMMNPDPFDDSERLSFHFFHAQRFPEAWRYSLAAAERARAIYANVEAAEFYERAIDAGRRLSIDTTETARVTEALGDVRQHFGAHREASVAYAAVRKLATGDPVAQARLMLKMGWMQGWLGKYSKALSWIKRALNMIDGIGGTDASQQRAQLLAWYANFSEKEGKHHQAISWCRRAIEAASESGNRDALAQAYLVLDWALAELGTLETPDNMVKALALYEELGDLPGQSAILNNLGEVAKLQGRWTDALEFYERARDSFRRSGNPVRQAFAVYNIAEILSGQGHYDDAEKLYREAWRVWQAAGDRSGVSEAKSGVARLLAFAGKFEEARLLFDEAREDAIAIDAKHQAVDIDSRIVELTLLKGEHERALQMAEDVLDASRDLGGVPPQVPLLHLVRGYASMALGNLDVAREAFKASLEAGRARFADHDVALTLGAIARLASLEGKPCDAERAESNATLERLGIVAVPVLFLGHKPELSLVS